MKYKVIITGASGMVGEGVLLECLEHPEIETVLSLSRKPLERAHPKLKEYIVPDFLELEETDEHFKGYDACFYCAGVSSIGMSETDYTRITFHTTLRFAKACAHQNPDMVFIYVSGAGTDSTEIGRSMWARVKGKTENALCRLLFKKVYLFRPGFLKLTRGQKNELRLYKYIGWLYPILKVLLPHGTSTLQQLGKAMIYCLTTGYPKSILEVKDINEISRLQTYE